MENNFDNALAYVEKLQSKSNNGMRDNNSIATMLVSYAAKTLHQLSKESQKFLDWENEWKQYDETGGKCVKPLCFNEFIKTIRDGQ